MYISLKYYNIVADFLGRREERRAVAAGTTVRELLTALAQESAPFRRLALKDVGEIVGQVRLFRNGQAVLDPDQALADGDEVQIFPVIAGG